MKGAGWPDEAPTNREWLPHVYLLTELFMCIKQPLHVLVEAEETLHSGKSQGSLGSP